MVKWILVSASTHPCKQDELIEYAKELENAGADFLHCDIMDGKFVKNKTYDYTFLSELRAAVKLPLDVHLMIKEPNKTLENYLESGASIITTHFEAFKSKKELNAVLDLLHSKGIKAGLSIKPGTPMEEIFPYLDKLYLVLVMSVEPGKSGQMFMIETYERLEKLQQERARTCANFLIEVDGGVNALNVNLLKNAGVDIVVAGSSLFRSEDRGEFIRGLKNK